MSEVYFTVGVAFSLFVIMVIIMSIMTRNE